MAYTITLLGEQNDNDEVREAFETAVRALPGTAGELVLDGITYSADDVPDNEAADTEEDEEEEAVEVEEEG